MRSVLGDAYENARAKLMNPDGDSSKGKKGTATNAKTKRKRNDEDEDRPKKKSVRSGKQPISKVKAGEDTPDHEDDEEDDAPANKKRKVEVLLAVKWDLEKGSDPSGWWVSEKLDGVRYVIHIIWII